MTGEIDPTQVDFGPEWRLRFKGPIPIRTSGLIDVLEKAVEECAQQNFQSGCGPYVVDGPAGRFTWRIRLGDRKLPERTAEFDWHVFAMDLEIFSQPMKLRERLWQEIQGYLQRAENRFFSSRETIFAEEARQAMDNAKWLLILNTEDLYITYHPEPDRPKVHLPIFAEYIPSSAEFLADKVEYLPG